MYNNKFEYTYDITTNEWVMTYDRHEVMRFTDEYVTRVSDDIEIIQPMAFRLMCADTILRYLENEENGFFVSSVLSKLFNYGMNWSKEVK